MKARAESTGAGGAAFITATLRVLWTIVRLPVLSILLICEPIVRFVCGLVLVLGVFVSLMFELSAAGPRFPFLWMMAFSLSFGAILILYYGLIELLSPS